MAANNGALLNPTLIVTRPMPQGRVFSGAIIDRWNRPLEIMHAPLLKIVPLPVAIDLSGFQGFIFSSVNGVKAVSDLRLPKGMTAWCVGERTAQAAKGAGFAPVVGPSNADGLVDVLLSAQPKGPLVHIRGQHSRGHIADRLSASGIPCAEVVGYDQEPVPLSDEAVNALKQNRHVIFPLFSPRTATLLTRHAPFAASINIVAISRAVERAAADLDARCTIVSDRPDMSAMVDATIGCLNALNSRVN